MNAVNAANMESEARQRAFERIRARREEALRRFPDIGKRAREIKERTIAELDRIVPATVAKLEEKKCQVTVADTAAVAAKAVTDAVDEEFVVVSRCNTAAEIDMDAALKAKGVRVVQTHVGDYLLGLSGQRPSHPLAPAIHLTKAQALELLAGSLGLPAGTTPEAAMLALRQHLRQDMATARYGISGASAITSEHGSLILAEDEGNVRGVSNLPHCHIAVAGIDKIVTTPEEAFTLIQAASIYGTGKDFATYVSVVSGPSRTADIEFVMVLGMHGPKEVRVVLLDNGRKEAIARGYGELLYCLNCGGCLLDCAAYRDHGPRFGHRYLGGRGVLFAAFHDSPEAAREALGLCDGCGKCVDNCPVQIDIPALVKRMKADMHP